MKKSILILLTALVCALMITGAAAAETSGTCGDGVTWTLSEAGVLTVSGSGAITEHPWTGEETIGLVKEASIGKGITEICDSAFNKCSALTKVTLPDTLTKIGSGAFGYCNALKEISIPQSVKQIGYHAFGYFDEMLIRVSSEATAELVSKAYHFFRLPGLKYSQKYRYGSDSQKTGLVIGQVDQDISSFTFPEGTTVIDDKAFYGCTALTSIKIPEGMTEIGWEAFSGCSSLGTVSLPSTLTKIGTYAFEGCTALKELTLPEEITQVISNSFFVSYSKSIPVFVKVGSETEKTLSGAGIGYRESGMNYSFRRIFDGDGKVTGTELVSVDDGITAFTVPESITGFAAGVFSGKSRLQSVTVPAAIAEIGSEAFSQYGGYVYFKGKAPVFAEDAFSGASVIAVYPHDQEGWKETIQNTYGARTLIWESDAAQAQEDPDRDSTEELKTEETDNESRQDVSSNWSNPVGSYLHANEDGTLLRVEHVGENAVVELYSAEMKLSWKKTVPLELPLWGGFFAGKNYNFLVVGQENPEEDDNAEVIRVIRYSQNWHRMDSLSIRGHNTVAPFDAGSLRMTEAGDFLYIHTCHLMYKSSDGRNHQANMSFQIYEPTMTVTRDNYLVSNEYYDYVSHSFDQHVLNDGADIIKVDQGDAYPRAVTLMKIADTAGSPGYGKTTRVTLLKISGSAGANYTGVSIGGVTASGSRYIVAGNSIDQNNFEASKQRNLFVASVPKNEPADDKVTVRWLTSYPEDSGIHISTPQIVPVDGSRQLLLWTESRYENYAEKDKVLKYVFINESGAAASDVYEADARLSDCRPVIRDGKVVWYVTEDSGSVFFIIDPADPGNVQRVARSSWVKLTAGWYYYDENGKAVTGWLPLGGVYYYMDSRGLMVTGWQPIDGKHYLFDNSGAMKTETWYTDDAGRRYYLGADGAAVTGIAVTKDPYWNYDSETGEVQQVTREVTHFFDGEGVMQTGWQTADGKRYYFDDQGEMVHDTWKTDSAEDGTTVTRRLGPDGAMITGWMNLQEEDYQYNQETGEWEKYLAEHTYYLDADGRRTSGWVEEDGKYYYLDEGGRMMRSRMFTDTDGSTYYLGADGAMQTGFLQARETVYEFNSGTGNWEPVEKEVYYYFDPDGKKATGWRTAEDGKTYYFDENGIMATGDTWIGQEMYHFDQSGAYEPPQQARGWTETEAGWTFVKDDGNKATDWLEIDGTYYCFDENGLMRTGWYEENGYTYYMDESGKMVTGDVEIDGTAYRFNEGGACTGYATEDPETPEPGTPDPADPNARGWVYAATGWTYVKDDGTRATGWLNDGGTWYYMNDSGYMLTGWVGVNGTWYYMQPSGAMATGWVNDGGTWYYMKFSGAMATGWLSDGGTWYYMRPSGAMATGWVYDGNAWYYMQPSGAMATGWMLDRGTWYYFRSSGVMVSEWQKIGGTWYYFYESGAMATGWYEEKDAWGNTTAWYWFDDSGAMATGWKEINGQWEMFADSGAWLYTWDGN